MSGHEQLVHLLEHLARVEGPLGRGAEDAPGGRHDHRRRNTLVGDVADDQADLPVRKLDEVVEVAADGTCRPVVRGDLPAGKVGELGRQEVLLDEARDLELLLDPLPCPHLGLLLAHELADPDRRSRLCGEVVE